MTALDFIDTIMRPAIPMSAEKPCAIATRSEVRRWLDQSSVVINDCRPRAVDLIDFPVRRLVFFPKSTKRCSVI